jgi:hypothetical protein
VKYAVEMGSGTMTRIPSFIRIGFSVQGITETGRRSDKSTLGNYANK